MKLQSIELDGMKGIARKVPITDRMMIAGPNGSGKTSVAQAIRVALLGYEPSIGKAETRHAFAPQHGAEWSVTLTNEQGHELTRRYCDGKETVRQKPGGKIGVKDAARVIADIYGDQSSLDLSAIVSMSPAQRATFILGLLPDGSASVESLLESIPEATDELAKAIRSAWDNGASLPEKIERCLSAVDELLNSAITAEREAQSALAAVSVEEVEAVSPEDVQAARAAVDEHRKGLDDGIKAAAEKQAAYDRMMNEGARSSAESARVLQLKEDAPAAPLPDALPSSEIESLQDSLDSMRSSLRSAEAVAASILATKQQLGRAESYLNSTEEEVRNSQGALASAQAFHDELPGPPSTRDDQLTKSFEEATRIEGEFAERLHRAEQESESLRSALADVDSASCTTCGQALAPVKESLQARLDDLGIELLRRNSDSASVELSKLREEMRCAAQWSDSRAKVASIGIALKSLEATRDVALAERDAAVESMANMPDEVDALEVQEKIDAVKAKLNAHTRAVDAIFAIKAHEQSIERATAQLEETKARLSEATKLHESIVVPDIEAMRESAAEASTKLEAVLAASDRYARSQGAAKKLKEASAVAELASEEASTFRKLLRVLRTRGAAMSAEVLAPVIGSASELLGRINEAWMVELRSESGGMNLYAVTHEGRPAVPWGALSGGEAVAFGAALSLALTRLIDPECKILLIEAAEVDASNLAKLLDGISEMANGWDHVIVSTHGAPEVVEGWEIVHMGEEVLAS